MQSNNRKWAHLKAMNCAEPWIPQEPETPQHLLCEIGSWNWWRQSGFISSAICLGADILYSSAVEIFFDYSFSFCWVWSQGWLSCFSFFFPFAFFVDRKRKQDQKHLVFWRLLVFEVLIKLYSLLLCYIKRRGKGKCWKRLVKIEKSVFFFPGFTFVFFFLIITCNSALHQAIIAESLSRKKSWRKRHLYCERVHFLSPFLC